MKKIVLLTVILLAQLSFAQVIEDIEIIDVEVEEVEENPEIPFSIIEKVPVYEGCQDLKTNLERKDCFNDLVNKHVSRKFNVDLANQLNLEGRIRIVAVFKIDTSGQIIDIKTRASQPKLQEEATRVINLIPKMHAPGMQRGKPVIVTYALPIIFNAVVDPAPEPQKTYPLTKQEIKDLKKLEKQRKKELKKKEKEEKKKASNN